MAADHLILSLPGSDADLVLGMRWHTILGSDLAARARQKARELRATHYAHAGGRSEAVGTLRLGRADRRGAGVRHSAALSFACREPGGVAALAARVPDGRSWLVAVQAGKVLTHTDRLFADAAAARAALADLASRYDGLRIHGDPDDGAEALAALAGHADAQASLRRVGWSIAAGPLPWRTALLAGVLVGGAHLLWPRAGQAPVRPAPEDDPVVAWTQALDRHAAAVQAQDGEGSTALLDALAMLPLEQGGWRLRGARCEPGLAGWQCVARFERHARGASNASFAAAMPAGWQPAWQPTEAVAASFGVPVPGSGLTPAALPSRARHEVELMSALQQALPAFSSVRLGEARPFAAQAGMVRPAGAPAVSERVFELEGPLRSLYLLPALLPGPVAWRSARLSVEDGARPALGQSRLMAALTGVLYAKE